MRNDHRFSDSERAAIYRVIAERRDIRHFLPDPVDPAVLQRLLAAAHQAPSVGLMQPWRFIRITDKQLRNTIATMVEEERRHTAEALAERSDEFMRLKTDYIYFDKDHNPVYMAETGWALNVAIQNHPHITFHTTSEFKTAVE